MSSQATHNTSPLLKTGPPGTDRFNKIERQLEKQKNGGLTAYEKKKKKKFSLYGWLKKITTEGKKE